MKIQTRLKCVAGPTTYWVPQIKVLFWWKNLVLDKSDYLFHERRSPKFLKCRTKSEALDMINVYIQKRRKSPPPPKTNPPLISYTEVKTHQF